VLDDLVGRSFDDVITYLQDEGLEADPVAEAKDGIAENEVWEQSPAAGTEVQVGDTVRFKFNPPAELKLVPDLRGKTLPEAEQLLAAEGFTIGNVTTAIDDSIPEGQIISTTPAAGDELAAGSAVAIVVSEGSEKVAIPDVATQRADSALNLLQSEPYRFIVNVQTVDDNDVPEGDVVSTDPSIGTSVEVGSRITMFVSRGPARQQVPGVEGFSEADARQLLSAAGFTANVIYVNVPAGDSNDGVVISQTPGEGAPALPASTVTLRVGRAVAAPTTTAPPQTTTT
jgi:eukaryotic-like serine/threonine-protein kinase